MIAQNASEWWLEYDSKQDYEDAMHAQAEAFWRNRGLAGKPDPARVAELMEQGEGL